MAESDDPAGTTPGAGKTFRSGKTFRAGAAAIEITPEEFPRIIAGSFLEKQASQVNSRLFARGFVLDDGVTRLALVVVDTCMMPTALIDDAKRLAAERCEIRVDHMMVSATHTHAAPAAMGCLGTRQDPEYAAALPAMIADAIVAADANLQPARIGWASVDDWEHTHNRRWIRKPENLVVDPFGNATGRAHMHPGYQSPDVIGPSGPVDPQLSLLALQTSEGEPLGVFANYSQHYFGASPVSADYYGRFCQYVAETLDQPGEGNGPFVCAMSQGTSGDLMWMDYGSPRKQLSMERYAEGVARYAERALASVRYHDTATLAVVEKKLRLRYRVPDQARLEWAEPIAKSIEDGVAKDKAEVYAREALILHERQATELKLQAIRVGGLTITTLPNEVYALTGLKLKAQAPLQTHLNVGLANGAEGYIPPPEQHALGGYTTWPARTAGLEVEAEPKIVETLLQAVEEASGSPRREIADRGGVYAKAILEAGPDDYWRLDDMAGTLARNAVAGGSPARMRPGFAWYLPGVGSGSGVGDQERLRPSNFTGPSEPGFGELGLGEINRAVHLAGGRLEAELNHDGGPYSVAVWFWLGERSGASERSGSLITLPGGESLVARQRDDHRVRLQWADAVADLKAAADQWQFVVLVLDGQDVRVHVDGDESPALTARVDVKSVEESPAEFDTDAEGSKARLRLGDGLQGKLDEVAVFGRALTGEEIRGFWEASGVSEQRAEADAERERQRRELAERVKPPKFPDGYSGVIAGMDPIVAADLRQAPETDTLRPDGNVSFTPLTFGDFRSGRLDGDAPRLDDTYSVSLWFRCETPNDVQPVTAYFFSRGPRGDREAPGDHLGIGGTYREEFVGKLLFFNGNRGNQAIAGSSVIPPGTWNHVVMVRNGERVTAWLNGEPDPEIDAEVEVTVDDAQPFFLGARSDRFAPLRGQLAHFALFDRALTADEATRLHAASDQPKGTPKPAGANNPTGSDDSAAAPKPSSEPKSAAESMRSIHVPDGFRVELVAAEPDLLDPVAFDWDHRGRLWVVEMADYPLGMDGKGQPGGRIRVLEDTDGDGRYDASRLFAEGLNFPTGILTWRDGVIVTAAPEILWLRDTDGDGRADVREVLIEGFHEGNQQLRVNGLRWGLDGWVHCANGGHHAGYGIRTEVRSRRTGTTYAIGSRDFCFRPDSGELRLESGPTQFGRNRDAWGNWFGTQNANPLWHYVIDDRYLSRNPYVPATQPIRHLIGPGSPEVFPASPPQKRFHNFHQSGRFTSACGGTIDGDDRLFGPSDESHAFVCEPFHNLVQHQVLAVKGASFEARRDEGEEEHDFFASEDRWCRPVMVRTGPDGALWVADMYRYMIEHPEWLPAEGKAELMPHYRLGDDRGRIYRVVADEIETRDVASLGESLGDFDLRSLVRAIDSPNAWQRDKVHQMLLWSEDPEAVSLLAEVHRSSSLPEVRVQTLWALESLGGLDSSLLVRALRDDHPRVRETAVRLSERRDTPEIVRAATRLAGDPDPHVRLQLALSCGEWSDERAGEALASIATAADDDPMMVAAVMSSAIPHVEVLLPAILAAEPATVAKYRPSLLRQALGSGDRRSIVRMLDDALAGAEPERSERERSGRLGEFLTALDRIGSSLDELVDANPGDPVRARVATAQSYLSSAVNIVNDADEESGRRLAAAKLLSHSPPHRPLAAESLAEWLRPHVKGEIQTDVMNSLARTTAESVPEILAQAWRGLSPKLRSEALAVWLSRTAWTEDLLRRIENGEILPSDLQPVQQSRLRNHPDKAIARLAESLFATNEASAPKELIEQYREALDLSGDSKRGKAVYLKTCASCHRRGDEGHDAGPNLATVIHHSPEKLLANILDPNADIQPGYQVYNCLLESGEVLSGILSGETANSLTITSANGVVRTVGRDEVEELQNLGISLMPEGLHEQLSVRDMADLMVFLKEPITQ